MKKRFLCQKLPLKGTPVFLSESEIRHALRVLRLRDGEVIEAIDGKGNGAKVLLRTHSGGPHLEYLEGDIQPPSPIPRLSLTLEIAVLKNQAMEWVIEKSVELGVQRITPVLTQRTVVQTEKKGPEIFQTRWQKIADQALKQCGRLHQMEIQTPKELNSLFSTSDSLSSSALRLWCDEECIIEWTSGDPPANAPYLMNWIQKLSPILPSGREIKILVGPEGGWSPIERKNLLRQVSSSFQRIHLGPQTLRAETAALFAVSLVSAQLRSNDYSSF